jgi:prepilin-type N-terminal cleavage/methylation domain-containing protein
MHHRGFSLIELVIVVAVVLVLSAAALPGLTGMVTDTSIYEVSTRLQQDIRLVQQLSITRRSGYPALRIDFSPSGRSYSVVTAEKTLVRTFPSSITVSLEL